MTTPMTTPVYDHILVMTTSYPGYWGRGRTFAEAVTAAQYIKPTAEVLTIRCTATAYVDGMGYAYGTEPDVAPVVGKLAALRRRWNANELFPVDD